MDIPVPKQKKLTNWQRIIANPERHAYHLEAARNNNKLRKQMQLEEMERRAAKNK